MSELTQQRKAELSFLADDMAGLCFLSDDMYKEVEELSDTEEQFLYLLVDTCTECGWYASTDELEPYEGDYLCDDCYDRRVQEENESWD